jgi:hypothetical protein
MSILLCFSSTPSTNIKIGKHKMAVTKWKHNVAIWLFYASIHKYEIDKVTDVRQAPSLKGGGLGIRYTCRILGKEVYLFCDEGKWFIEK